MSTHTLSTNGSVIVVENVSDGPGVRLKIGMVALDLTDDEATDLAGALWKATDR